MFPEIANLTEDIMSHSKNLRLRTREILTIKRGNGKCNVRVSRAADPQEPARITEDLSNIFYQAIYHKRAVS